MSRSFDGSQAIYRRPCCLMPYDRQAVRLYAAISAKMARDLERSQQMARLVLFCGKINRLNSMHYDRAAVLTPSHKTRREEFKRLITGAPIVYPYRTIGGTESISITVIGDHISVFYSPSSLVMVRRVLNIMASHTQSLKIVKVESDRRVTKTFFIKVLFMMHYTSRNMQTPCEASFTPARNKFHISCPAVLPCFSIVKRVMHFICCHRNTSLLSDGFIIFLIKLTSNSLSRKYQSDLLYLLCN